MNNINLNSISSLYNEVMSYMGGFTLTNVWYFLLLIPLFLIIVIPFCFAVGKTNKRWYNVCSNVLHIILAIIITFTAVGVIYETTLTQTMVYVVADVSYSLNKSFDTIDEYIYQIESELPDNSQMGVVVFGKDYEINTKVSEKFESVRNNSCDDTGTDIASALTYTCTLFNTTAIKRIVLITDAMQTSSTDSELRSAVQYCEDNDITIDAIYIDSNIDYENDSEIQITSVDCNNVAYKGYESVATALIQSTYVTAATLELYEVADDGTETLVQSTIEALGQGGNDVEIELPIDREEGTYSYKLTVVDENDTSNYNNTVSFTQTVESLVKILFISEDEDDENRVLNDGLFSALGDDIKIDSYTVTDYTVNDFDVPTTIEDIVTYDIIVLSNVDLTHINSYETFIDNLEIAVSSLGKTLLAFGDLHLQEASHDDSLAKLAGMLPVSYGSPTLSGGAYTIVVDCSYSMTDGDCLTRAKEVALALINMFDVEDYVYIYIFFSDVDDASYAGLANSDATSWIEDNILPHQGTSYTRALSSATDRITAMAQYDNKGLFFISDNNTTETISSLTTYLDQFINAEIPVTCVNVSSSAYNESSILYQMKNYTGGSIYNYNTTGEDELNAVLDVITSNEVGEYYVTAAAVVYVKARYYYDSVLSNLTSSVDSSYRLGTVNGYVLARTKASGTAVLTAQYKATDTSYTYEVPIYAYQNYGNGTACAFTSYISATSSQIIGGDYVSQIGVDYTGSTFYKEYLKTFIGNVLTTNMPDEKITVPYTVSLVESGDSYIVNITPLKLTSSIASTIITVTVKLPDGSYYTITSDGSTYTTLDSDGEEVVTQLSEKITLNSTYFYCSFEATDLGNYAIVVDYELNSTVYDSYTSYLSLSYLDEYNAFETFSPSILYLLLGSSGGTVNTTGDYVLEFNEEAVSKQYVDYSIPLLIAAVVIFVVDIFIRKIRWADILSLFGVVNRRAKKEQAAKEKGGNK